MTAPSRHSAPETVPSPAPTGDPSITPTGVSTLVPGPTPTPGRNPQIRSSSFQVSDLGNDAVKILGQNFAVPLEILVLVLKVFVGGDRGPAAENLHVDVGSQGWVKTKIRPDELPRDRLDYKDAQRNKLQRWTGSLLPASAAIAHTLLSSKKKARTMVQVRRQHSSSLVAPIF